MWDARCEMRGGHAAFPHQGAGMSSRGFALLAVLWTLTAVTAFAGVVLAVARLGSTTTRNRVLLARAAWAREGCVEILLARWASPPDPLSAMRRGGTIVSLDSVDLGRGTWCSATLEDPSTKLNLNLADRRSLPYSRQSCITRSPSIHSPMRCSTGATRTRCPGPLATNRPGTATARSPMSGSCATCAASRTHSWRDSPLS